MTSRKSFCNFKMIYDAVMESKYVSILHFIVLFLGTTLPAIILNSDKTENTVRMHEDLLTLLSGANPLMVFISALAGFVVSGLMFSFLYNSNSTVFYHSMPYKRVSLYITRALGGIISLVIPFIAIFAINSIMYFYMGISVEGGYAMMIKGALLVLGMYLVFFAVSTFAAVLSGNRFAQCIIIAFVFFAFHISLFVIAGNFEQWFTTYTFNIGGNYKYIIPPAMLFDVFVSYGEKQSFLPDAAYCLIYSLVFLALGAVCYKYRKSENSNKFFAFHKINVFLKYYITTFASLAFGLVLMSATDSENLLVGYISYLVFAFVSYIALQAVFELNYKSMFKNMKQFAVYAVILAAVLTVPLADVLKLDERPNNLANKDAVTVTFGNEELVFKEKENIEKADAFFENAWRSNMQNTMNRTEFANNYREYVSADIYTGFFFSVKRIFSDVDSNIADDFYKDVYDTAEVKSQIVPQLEGEEYEWLEIEKWSSVTLNSETKNYKTEICNIVNALKSDIIKYSYEDIQNSYVVAHIVLAAENTHRVTYFDVYSCYENTLGIIEKYLTNEWNAEKIGKITLYDLRKRSEDYPADEYTYVITDKEKMAEILERITTRFNSGEGFEAVIDEYYHIGFIPAKGLPEFILSE